MNPRKWKRQSSVHSLQALALEETRSASPGASSPASSIHEGARNSGLLSSMKRSLSRASLTSSKKHTSTDPATPGTPPTPPSRRVLHKSSGSFSSFENVRRRSSAASDLGGYRRQSRALSLSLTSSRLPMTEGGIDLRTAIDWKSQRIEAHCGLEADPQVLRSKPSYLVVTPDYIVKMRSRTEALAAFPQIASGRRREEGPGSSSSSSSGLPPPPEPVLVIPVHTIVSVFMAETSRPSFGIEIWWKPLTARAAYASAQAYFVKPEERSEMIKSIGVQVKAKTVEFPEASLVPLEVEAKIIDIFAREEPDFQTCKPEVFPVVKRTPAREDVLSKDKTRKACHDGASWYLALGRNACYLVEVAQGTPLDIKYQAFGLVTLEAFRANWTFHEERFVLSFREPFKPTVTLELASRHYRQIVITFMKADRFLKPCWPTGLQTLEVFRISGLTDPQLLIAGDNYGGLHRTLDAFLTAYHCSPVEWEINWKTAYAPEFRLLPPKSGGSYSNPQLLAVMRSLRYNGYFNSISFAGVNLSGLWETLDTAGRTPVPYMNRSCLALSEVELGHVMVGSLLHKEMHALAFCSETVRQIDLSNCFSEWNVRRTRLCAQDGPGFLFPILNLLELGLTKCNRLVLGGNYLRPADIQSLVEALMTQQVEIQALDISNCGLSDLALRDIFEVLFHQRSSLQALNVSGNRGRIHASLVANLCQTMLDLRALNVAGVLMGDIPGPILSCDTLSRFEYLEELDLSQYKANEATLNALEYFLNQRPAFSVPRRTSFYRDLDSPPPVAATFRKLVLNNCGINGREAARLTRALANHASAHLHLNGNPLEDGLEDLCLALSRTSGPAGLHMDMVEFRHESSFVALIEALTANTHIHFLSMAGTAPSPSVDGPCDAEVSEALEAFFQGNTSVRYLDLSGYSGKLDEGQLAPGFARSLRGLATNNTLTHLRIRNQNLHDDVGALGTVMRQNTTLRMMDCQENGWNLTSMQFLVKSLKLNKTIVHFPLPHPEYERILGRVVADTKRQATRGTKAMAAMLQAQETVLRTALLRQVHELRETVVRNQSLAEGEASRGVALDYEDSADAGGATGWPSLQMKAVSSVNNLRGSSSSSSSSSSNNSSSSNSKRRSPPARRKSSLPHTELRVQTPSRLLDLDLDADLMETPVTMSPADVQVTRTVHEITTTTTSTTTTIAACCLADDDDDEEEEEEGPPATTGSSSSSSSSDEEEEIVAVENNNNNNNNNNNPYHVERDAPLLETPGADAGGCSPTDCDMPCTPPATTSLVAAASEESSSSSYEFLDAKEGEEELLPYYNSPSFDTFWPYFFAGSGSGRDFGGSRFRFGGLEAHEEE